MAAGSGGEPHERSPPPIWAPETPPAAHAELVAARDINAKLVQLSPDNADWRNDLASVEKALTELGD